MLPAKLAGPARIHGSRSEFEPPSIHTSSPETSSIATKTKMRPHRCKLTPPPFPPSSPAHPFYHAPKQGTSSHICAMSHIIILYTQMIRACLGPLLLPAKKGARSLDEDDGGPQHPINRPGASFWPARGTKNYVNEAFRLARQMLESPPSFRFSPSPPISIWLAPNPRSSWFPPTTHRMSFYLA